MIVRSVDFRFVERRCNPVLKVTIKRRDALKLDGVREVENQARVPNSEVERRPQADLSF